MSVGNTQIVRLALQHIGDRFDISDIDEETVEAEQGALVFDEARRSVLRQHAWGFANKFVSPATLNVTVPGQWLFAYAYPSDAVRVLEIVNPLGRDLEPIEFERALIGTDDTEVLLTDQSDAEFKYTKDVTDPTRFDPEFVLAFSYELAAMMAMSLTGDPGIKGDLMKEAEARIFSASTSSANEGRSTRPPEASWIEARD